MSAGGRQTALDPAVGALPGANAVPLDQLSASERSTSWRTRFLLREWVAGSLFVIPTLYMATALALAEILPRIEGSRDVLSLNFANDTARTFYSAVAGGMIAFTGLVVSIAVVVVQFGASQYTPRLVSRFRRDPIVKHALGAFIAPAMFSLVSLGEHRAQRRDRRPERGHHGGPRPARRGGARLLRARRPPARPAAPAAHRGADRR